jgi:tRNA-specific 2-thiouridylase
MFPLGDTTKDEVRAEAARRGLAVADKPDSHDICFIADGDTRGFLAGKLGARQGPIVDAESGEVLGTHDGSFGFTVGQRRGLNLSRPAAGGDARYVLSIRPADNTVVVGARERLAADVVEAAAPVWTSGAQPGDAFDCTVQLRAHGMTSPATVQVAAGVVTASLDGVQHGVAAGQALVMYDGDAVLGSATITAAHRRVATG